MIDIKKVSGRVCRIQLKKITYLGYIDDYNERGCDIHVKVEKDYPPTLGGGFFLWEEIRSIEVASKEEITIFNKFYKEWEKYCSEEWESECRINDCPDPELDFLNGAYEE